MAKLESSFKNMFLVLIGVAVIASAALAYVYDLTKEPIEKAAQEKVVTAIKAVTPPFDNQPNTEAILQQDETGTLIKIYPAKKEGQMVGAAVESYTKKGFSGEIKVMVGFDKEGVVTGYSVLQHAETPGLGSKMEEWFRENKNQQNIIGINASQALKVTKDGGSVDAITAATISSRAFLDAVNRAYGAYRQIESETAPILSDTIAITSNQ